MNRRSTTAHSTLSLEAAWHAGRALRFSLLSGVGLGVDVCLFLALNTVGFSAFIASCLSSSAAVTFVYWSSVRRLFRYEGEFIVGMFAAYATYQICGISLSAWAVSELITTGLNPVAAKAAILPVTFVANYGFMSWLTTKPFRWVRG